MTAPPHVFFTAAALLLGLAGCSSNDVKDVSACVPSGVQCATECATRTSTKVDASRHCMTAASYSVCAPPPDTPLPTVISCCQDSASGEIFMVTAGGCPAYANGVAWHPCAGDAASEYQRSYGTTCK